MKLSWIDGVIAIWALLRYRFTEQTRYTILLCLVSEYSRHSYRDIG
ncbi:MAG: hypothetical protein JRJ65_13690 [Deltaproteobacteria bacterium]|nr:hypothetical protein [Deltaproteobacteria bacterium]